jgi:putative transposase
MGLVDRDDGWRMPDWLWEKIEPLLPPPPAHPLGTHKRGLPKRQVMDAILLVLRTGMQWNALDVTGVCNSSTAHRRFQEWERAGVFHEIWRQGLLDCDSQIGIDWSWLAADGGMSKAPLGGPKTGPNPTDRAKGGRSARSSQMLPEGTRDSVPIERPEPTEPIPRASASTRPTTSPSSATCSQSASSHHTSALAARRSISSSTTPTGERAAGWSRRVTHG